MIKQCNKRSEKIYVRLSREKPGFFISENRENFYQAPKLNLEVGTQYHFDVKTPGQLFYITSDSEGGGLEENNSLKGAITIQTYGINDIKNGTEDGFIIWTPTKIHKTMEIYYQSNNKKNMGNKITVFSQI